MAMGSLIFYPILFFASFLLGGIILKKVFFPRLERLVSKTPWLIDKAAMSRLRSWILVWFVLFGFLSSIHYLRTNLEYFEHLRKVIILLLSFTFIFFLAQVAGDFVRAYVKKVGADLARVSILEHFTKGLIITLGVLIILYSFGVPLGPVLTGFGIGGIAVALALQDTLANFFSGLYLLMSKQIRPGDYIKLDSGEEGYVVDITWRNTVIRELRNNYIIVPNSRISKAVIKNYYLPEKEVYLAVEIGISYESDLGKVERVIRDVGMELMNELEGGIRGFEPIVRFSAFSDFSIKVTVILKAQEIRDQYVIKHEFIKRLFRRFKEEKIAIPYPVRTVYLKGGEKEPEGGVR